MGATETHIEAGKNGDAGGTSDEDTRLGRESSSVITAEEFAYSDDRKIGVTGAVFLILNKMIGTGSMCCPYP